MRRLCKHVGNEEGSTIVFVAVSMAMLLSVAAIAVDLGMLFSARSEAQRAADAGALAGASTFQTTLPPEEVVAEAERRTRDFAGRNWVRGALVQPDEVGVEVFVANGRVRATVRRQAIPLWFARIFGVNAHAVAAVAAARVQQSGTAECMAPLMIPDAWEDTDSDGMYDAGETYTPRGTSYGSAWRDAPTGDTPAGPGYPRVQSQGDFWADVGRQITLKTGSPNQTMQAGWYFPVRIGTSVGGADFRANLGQACPPQSVSIGDEIYNEPGNMVGPTKQGFQDRVAQDPDAVWVPGVGIQYSRFGGGSGDGSPRVMVVPLFNPTHTIPNGASAPMRIEAIGTFFIESMHGDGTIYGRWMRVRGAPDNCEAMGNCQSNITSLRLVE